MAIQEGKSVNVNEDDDFDFKDEDIEIVDDTPEEDRGREAMPALPVDEEPPESRADELENLDMGVRARINKLTHRYHDERRAREQSERQAQEAIRFAQQAWAEKQRIEARQRELTQTLAWGQDEYVKEAQARIEAAEKLAEQEYRRAYEAGDTDGVLEAQKALHAVQSHRDRLLNFRPPISQEELQAQQNLQAQNYANSLQPQQNPVYSQPNVAPAQQPPPQDPKAVAWAAKNPWFGSDPEMTALAYGTHTKLVSSGVDPQSDEYYAALDKRMRDVYPEQFGKPKRSSPVAPASRSTASRKIQLSKEQVRLANRLGVPLTEYAKHVAKLENANH